jgi:hypothetical protein
MVIEHDDDLRHLGYYLVGGFDPALPFLSEEAGLQALRTRKGKPDAVKRLFCPYTGKPVELVERNNLWFVEGSFFSPSKRYQFDADLMYEMSFRGGKKPGFERNERPKIEVIGERVENSDPTLGLTASDDLVDGRVSQIMGE